MSFHDRLARYLRTCPAPIGVLHHMDGTFYRMCHVLWDVTYVFDVHQARYYDRLHPLSDRFYERVSR